jgi:hypothetical protein
MSQVSEIVREIIAEANVQRMGRKKLVRARVRGGKIQRRKVLSAVPGYTIRGGRLVRIPPQERLKRKLSLIKRKRSLRKRASLGL